MDRSIPRGIHNQSAQGQGKLTLGSVAFSEEEESPSCDYEAHYPSTNASSSLLPGGERNGIVHDALRQI